MNKSIATVFMTGFIALGSTGSFAALVPDNGCPDPSQFPLNGCSLPGLRDGSFPYVDAVVGVTASVNKKGKETIKANGYKGSVSSLFFDDTGQSFPISKMKFSLKATTAGTTSSGTISISGTIGGTKGSMKADIGPEFAFNGDHTMVGFNTNNMTCKDGLAGLCSSGEVVYLNLLEAIPTPLDVNTKVSTAGRAITSLPVPAAAWLFGSGLLGLVAVSRRRRAA